MSESHTDQSARPAATTSPAPVPRPCPSCQAEFIADDDLDTYCPECRERKTAFWAIAAFAILIVCFVVIPLVVQGFRPWR